MNDDMLKAAEEYRKEVQLREAAKSAGRSAEYEEHDKRARKALERVQAIRRGKAPQDYATRDDNEMKKQAAACRLYMRLSKRSKGTTGEAYWKERANGAARKLSEIRRSTGRNAYAAPYMKPCGER